MKNSITVKKAIELLGDLKIRTGNKVIYSNISIQKIGGRCKASDLQKKTFQHLEV